MSCVRLNPCSVFGPPSKGPHYELSAPGLGDLPGCPPGPETLLHAILDPNEAVEPRYLGYGVELKSGQTYFGIVISGDL